MQPQLVIWKRFIRSLIMLCHAPEEVPPYVVIEASRHTGYPKGLNFWERSSTLRVDMWASFSTLTSTVV